MSLNSEPVPGGKAPRGLVLDGPDRREVRLILGSAFNREELEIALRENASARVYEELVQPSDFSHEVFQLIAKAERQGWLDDLVELIPEQRQDLRIRADTILKRAEKRAMLFGGVDAFSRLRTRFFTLAIAFSVLVIMAIALGVMAYLTSPRIGIWAVPAVILAIVALAGSALLYARGDAEPTDLALSSLPLILLGIATTAFIVSGVVLYKAVIDDEPNFILTLTEENEPLAEQEVALKQKQNGAAAVDVTNAYGQAFFSLVFDSRVYWAEFRKKQAGELCQTPAFLIETAQKTLAFEVKELKCAGAGPSDPDLGVRTDDTPRAPSVGIDRTALPKNLTARNQRAPLGTPSAPLIFDRRSYSVGFDPELRAAVWVSFIVDENNAIRLQRQPDRFVPDPALPAAVQTRNDDYAMNPYDKGTLIRRVDSSYGATTEDEARLAEREVFYLSIVVPQPDKSNRITWLAVETLTGQMTRDHGEIHVFAGPVYEGAEANGSYVVVGPGKTLVPLQLYRVLLRQASDGKWRAIAFVVPNDGTAELDARIWATSVAKVEAITGLRFFQDLPADQQAIKTNSSLEVFLQ